MKKIDVINEVREVNENGKWETYTTTSQLPSSDFPDWSCVSIQRHCTWETYTTTSRIKENE